MNTFLLGIFEQGIIFSIAALGVYITYSILDFPDLSVDGSFPLGAAVSAALIVKGYNPWVSIIAALMAGALSGFFTGLLHVKLKITNLLSGILIMFALYSINLRIMGKSNVPLFKEKVIFSNSIEPIYILVILLIIVKIAMDLFFKTKLGYVLKATGDNATVVTSLGLDTGKIKILGLMISNGLVALSGAIMVQYQRFADISMGNGTIIIALASIILGQSIIRNSKLIKATTIVAIGSILYKLSIALALKLGLPPTDLKLVTAAIVVLTIMINSKKFSISFKKFAVKGGERRASYKGIS